MNRSNQSSKQVYLGFPAAIGHTPRLKLRNDRITWLGLNQKGNPLWSVHVNTKAGLRNPNAYLVIVDLNDPEVNLSFNSGLLKTLRFREDVAQRPRNYSRMRLLSDHLSQVDTDSSQLAHVGVPESCSLTSNHTFNSKNSIQIIGCCRMSPGLRRA